MVILIIFLTALVFRLLISPLGFHVDIFSNAGWGQWIYQNGTLGFYEATGWIYSSPTQPPFVSLIYGFNNYLYVFLLETFRDLGHTIVKYHLAPGKMVWFFEFTKWFDIGKVNDEAVYITGYLATIKILPILADLGIASIIYLIAKEQKAKVPTIWPLIYLVSPFSWYLSGLWGQYDQLSFLPILLAFILESKKKFPILTPILFALSIAIKPTSLILVPIFIYIYIRNSHKKIEMATSGISIFIFFYATTNVFTNIGPIEYSWEVLSQKIFNKSATRLSANSFNFWRIFQTNNIQTAETTFLFLPAYIWSYTAYAVLNLYAVKLLKKVNLKSTLTAVFIVSAGSFLFMTNMLDRYFFAGIVSGLIICIFNHRLLKYWLILSLIFWINLYNQWWFPEFLEPLYKTLTWQDGLITKLLSIINVIVFLQMLRIINADFSKKES